MQIQWELGYVSVLIVTSQPVLESFRGMVFKQATLESALQSMLTCMECEWLHVA